MGKKSDSIQVLCYWYLLNIIVSMCRKKIIGLIICLKKLKNDYFIMVC